MPNGDGRTTTFSVYLLHQDRTRAEEVLRSNQWAAFEEVALTSLAGRGVRAFLRQDQPTRPDWARALHGHLPDADPARLRSSSSGVVIVASVRGRLVALTFGMAWRRPLSDPCAPSPVPGRR